MPAEVQRILVVKLSAMGDIIHALAAACSLKRSFPQSRLSWLVKRKWAVLLEENPYVDEVIPFDRSRIGTILATRRALRAGQFDLAIDFQGLIQSATLARLSGAKQVWGFDPTELREKAASWLYTNSARAPSAHVVEKCLDLAESAGAQRYIEFPIATGKSEGERPDGP